MGLGRPAPDGARRYVVDVDITSRRVAVGPAQMLDVDVIRAERPRWCGPALERPRTVGVQVRAHGEEVPGRAIPEEGGFVVELATAIRGIAPGQTAVLYEGTRVVGSGTIVRQPGSRGRG